MGAESDRSNQRRDELHRTSNPFILPSFDFLLMEAPSVIQTNAIIRLDPVPVKIIVAPGIAMTTRSNGTTISRR